MVSGPSGVLKKCFFEDFISLRLWWGPKFTSEWYEDKQHQKGNAIY